MQEAAALDLDVADVGTNVANKELKFAARSIHECMVSLHELAFEANMRLKLGERGAGQVDAAGRVAARLMSVQ